MPGGGHVESAGGCTLKLAGGSGALDLGFRIVGLGFWIIGCAEAAIAGY